MVPGIISKKLLASELVSITSGAFESWHCYHLYQYMLGNCKKKKKKKKKPCPVLPLPIRLEMIHLSFETRILNHN